MSRLRQASGDRPRDGRSCGGHRVFRRDPPPERRARQRRHRRENAQRDRRRDRPWTRDLVHGPRGEGGGGPLRPRGLPRARRRARAGRRRGLGRARPLGRRARPARRSREKPGSEVLAADPSHREANAALGRVEVDGTWMGQDEAYRARGYVSFEGRWVTPPEHEALVRERAAEEASERETREAGLRVREAEARAREAEARAREAEIRGAAGGRRHPLLAGAGVGADGAGVGASSRPRSPRGRPIRGRRVEPHDAAAVVHPTRPRHRPPQRATGRPQQPRPAQPPPAEGAGPPASTGLRATKPRQD